MPRTILTITIALPVLFGPGSYDSPSVPDPPTQQARRVSASRSLELLAHDPRGRPVYLADECVVELRRDGKRVWDRRMSFGVRELALDESGRVVLIGTDRLRVHGMDAQVSVLCFLEPGGEVIAVHETALRIPTPSRERHCPGDTVPLGGGTPLQRVFPMGGGWTLIAERGVHWTNTETRWQIYDELGRRLGEVDRHDLLPDAQGDVRCLSLDIQPGTRWAVAVWRVSGSAGASTQLVVHDLGARFAKELSARKLEPLWSGILDIDFPLLRTEVVHGTDPSVRIGVWKEFPESARFIVRRGPSGGVAVEQVEVGKRR
jgi:hypothetical protein